MLDASDTESLADEFDSLEVDYYSDGGDGYDSDICLDTTQVKKYSILKEEDIRRLQANDIATVSSCFSISKVAACILLRHYNWSVSKVDDAWFNDEDGVRRTAGLLDNPVVQFSNAKELTCGICFDSYPHDSIDAAACGHPYCSSCWTGYITTSINDGPVCLSLRCPDPSCGAAVGQDMINRHASDEDKDKYSSLLLRSYIDHEDNKKMKWCPAPGCECVVDFSGESGGVYDVSCQCSYKFCWNCTEEVHRPVDCSTVSNWLLKNKSESANVNWIIANSKPCPKCKRPIEKSQGCMHMVCSPPCKFHFCWLCLGEWSGHDDYYACNGYEEAKADGSLNKTEKRRERAKNSLERYTHYYERWSANQLSREKALVSLQQMPDVLELLSVVQNELLSQLKFITEAWLQIVECRRVLKWAYAYGYFIPEKERAKKRFFEYLQGEAESGLERLHQCAEKELQTFLNTKSPSEDFNAFRSKLADLTSVTRNYFENLVKALENGLEDVDAHTACAKTETKGSSENGETSKGKGGKKGKKAKSRASNRSSDE